MTDHKPPPADDHFRTCEPADESNAEAAYPEGSINRLVADRLADFAEKARKMGGAENGKNGKGDGRIGEDQVSPPKSHQ